MVFIQLINHVYYFQLPPETTQAYGAKVFFDMRFITDPLSIACSLSNSAQAPVMVGGDSCSFGEL